MKKIYLILLLGLTTSGLVAQNINTIAGVGTAGFSGDGGLATTAELKTPTCNVIDASGNIYIADFLNHRIRKIDATTGIITTVAGVGTSGYSGDGGAATSAELNHPVAIALDAAENLYIVDGFNHRVRMVTKTTGIIITVAGDGSPGSAGDGGPATSAQIYIPSDIAFDATGNLYIVEQGSHKVRKVTIATGIITTVAGVGTAGFSGDGGLATAAELNSPAGIALDVGGSLYISDYNNHRIRKVNIATGIITTVAGVGTAGFSGDGGAATTAELNHPLGISFDASGNLYIADVDNHRVRKVNIATGVISTVVGTGVSGFSGDGGLPTAAQLNNPYSIALDASENFYIADAGNNRIRKVTFCTPSSTTDTRTECSPFVWIDGNTYTSDNNTATHVLTSTGGCDSTVTLDLTITDVDVSVTQDDTDLLANEMVATYQWLDCDDNYSPLPNGTGRVHYGLADGNFAVEVTYYGCVDTSSCYTVSTVGIDENSMENSFTVYPNPAQTQLNITAENEEINSIKIIDVTGKVVQTFEENPNTINVADLSKGMYILQIQTKREVGTKRFIKE